MMPCEIAAHMSMSFPNNGATGIIWSLLLFSPKHLKVFKTTWNYFPSQQSVNFLNQIWIYDSKETE
jgi:hypothetical protein